MNYTEIKQYDVTNSVGISCTLFVSGCLNNCDGCFNRELQDFNYGKIWDKRIEDEFIKYCKHDVINNVCILGGEPFQQEETVIERLFERLENEVRKPLWVWTGLQFEYLLQFDCMKNILSKIDYLIDGRFIKELKDLSLKHRGSSNQRIINVKESLRLGDVVLAKEYY